MPKRNATRGGQRNKPRVQKHFELVRTATETPQPEVSDSPEAVVAADTATETEETAPIEEPKGEQINSGVVATAKVNGASRRTRVRSGRAAALEAEPKKEVVRPVVEAEQKSDSSVSSELPKGSAAARLAARRQAGQKAQQKSAASLISPEHYAYVRHDLVIIAILAIIMFAAIIILHFVPGIGY